MEFFLISALVGTSFFCAVLFSDPSRYYVAVRLPKGLRRRFVSWSRSSLLWLVLLGILPLMISFFLVFLVASLVHPSSSYAARVGAVFHSQAFSNVVFGLLFGVLLSLWIYRFCYLDSRKEDLDWRMKAQGVLLLFLFIAGSQEWFGALTDRLAKFSFGGAAIELSLPNPAKSSDQSPRLVASSQAANGNTTGGATPAVGLTILGQLDEIMMRDNASLNITYGSDSWQQMQSARQGHLCSTCAKKILQKLETDAMHLGKP